MSEQNENGSGGLSPLRFGIVSRIDAATGEAFVKFEDLDGLETAEIPLLYPKTLKDHFYRMLDAGEHVACLMDEHLENGVILGAVYDDENLPPEGDANKCYIQFENGTTIVHDKTSGNINIKTSGTVTIDSPNVTMTGDLHVNGDVTAGNISLRHHKHGGVKTGDGQTGKPQN